MYHVDGDVAVERAGHDVTGKGRERVRRAGRDARGKLEGKSKWTILQ